MADITSTIRYIADASQAIGTMRSLAAEAQALNQSVNSVQKQIISQQTGSTRFANNTGTIAAQIGQGRPGYANQLFNLPAQTQIDQFNKTLRTTYDTVVLNSQGMEIYRARVSNTTGDIREIEQALRSYTGVVSQADRAQQSVAQQLEGARGYYRNLRREIFESTAASHQFNTERLSQLSKEQEAIAQQRASILSQAGGPNARSGEAARQVALAQLDEQEAIFAAEQRALQGQQTLLRAQARDALQSDPLILQAKERIRQLEALQPQTAQAARNLISIAENNINRAVNLPPPLPASLETVRQESPQLFNRLAGQGLLGPQPGVVDTKAIYESGADQLRLTRDLERGTTSLSGAIRGLNGEIINVNAAYREGGTVIGRYGGALSGVQNFLRQTVNNFQKVVQWGLATTAVFAGLSLATSSIDTIIKLDAALNQLSITAQLSGTQTKQVFGDLAQIAYDTSTPLQDMVKAADDIALATKRANQSTVEWQTNIKSLATSVGVLTNITGLDTVRATDLLTSTIKQLNLSANDIPTILNKVAAVSGGQANAITDVVSGLGAMAEAAEQANLSIDQTIATVQVLGQVTSKSSTEVATAFKNLVGSVDSVGAKKAFENYDISVKDAQGNLRNILDIYGEIQDKIRSGVIPESDVKGLVKAIAGGPRRAPDAAALLANIDAIREATQVSINATNEAQVANAKYLDTIESKITQIQVRFQAFIQQTLGPGVKNLVGDIVNALGTVLDVIERFKDFLGPLAEITVKLGIFYTAAKVGSAIFGFFGKAWVDLTQALRRGNLAVAAGTDAFKLTGTTASTSAQVVAAAARLEVQSTEAKIVALEQLVVAARQAGNAELTEAREAQLAAAQNQRTAALNAEAVATQQAAVARSSGGGAGLLGGITAGNLARVGGNVLKVGLPGAVLSGALSLGTGSNPLKALGDAGVGAGISLLAAPITPLPIKALGLAIAAAGTILGNFADTSKEAAQSQKELKTEILATIDQYNQAQTSVKNLTKRQEELLQQYRQQQKESKGTVENINELHATVADYIQTSFDLKAANEQVAASFDKLKEQIPDLDKKFRASISSAQAGILSPEGLKKLQEQIYKEVFSSLYPEVNTAEQNLIKPTTVSSKFESPYEGSTNVDIKTNEGRGAVVQTIDLANLERATDILNLFSVKGDRIVASFAATAENTDLIRAALETASTETGALGDRAKAALATFTQWAATQDAIAQADIYVKQQDTLLTTQSLLKQISAEQLQQGQAVLKTYRQLIELAEQLPTQQDLQQHPVDYAGQQSREDFQKDLQKLLINPSGTIRTRPFNLEEATQIVSKYREQLGLSDDIKLSQDDIYSIMTQNLGLTVNWTSQLAQAAAESEALTTSLSKLDDLKTSSLDTMAEKIGDIQQRFLKGDITKKMRDSLIAAAKATNVLDNQLVAFFKLVADEGNPILLDFEKQISKIPGLENLVGKNADEAGALMIKWLDNMNLTGKGAQALTNRIITLIASISAIPPFKEFVLQFRTSFIQTEGNDPNSRDFTSGAAGTGGAAAQYSYNKIIGDIQKQIQKLLGQLQTVSSGGGGYTFPSVGGGSSGSTGGGTKPGFDISELDLPDEIANATDRDALIQEAIKRARALQHVIPGADKEAKNDIVELLKGTQRILEVRGVKDDYLRKALEELADVEKKRLEFETKADKIQRIRVGFGDFAALANVPLNSKTGVSVGGPEGPITVNLNINGQVLTPAQFAQLADQIAAAIKRQLAG